MYKLVFGKYDPNKNHDINVIYLALRTALLTTNMKPKHPEMMLEWVSMIHLFNKFGILESVVTNVVHTPNGEQSIEFVILNPMGGEVELDESSFNLLEEIWEDYVKNALTLSDARTVLLVRNFITNCKVVSINGDK